MKELFKIDNKNESKKILIMFALSRLLLFGLLIYYFIQNQNARTLFTHYDGINYLTIAKYGYSKKHLYAFFPLLPILIKISLSIFNSYVPLIIFFNFITYLTGVGIYNLTKEYYIDNSKISKLISCIWFFSPISIYTTVLYTEPLYCFLTVCILLLYKKREKPLLMGVLLGLLVCTRSTGSLLFFTIFICILIDYFRKNKKQLFNKKELLKEIKYTCIVYIPATIISCMYPLYLQIKVGSWRYFIDVQFEYWSGVRSNFFKTLLMEIDKFTNGHFESLDIWFKCQFLFNTVATYILLFCILVLIYKTIKNKKVLEKKELLIFLILNLCAIYSICKNQLAPTTSYYRYFISCMSLYLLVDDEFVARTMILMAILMNIIVSSCHILETIMF